MLSSLLAGRKANVGVVSYPMARNRDSLWPTPVRNLSPQSNSLEELSPANQMSELGSDSPQVKLSDETPGMADILTATSPERDLESEIQVSCT